MTYEYVENQVLKLLNQYTAAGEAVAETYNNQKDYLERIPSLVNDALMELSTTVRKIPVIIRLVDLESEDIGRQTRYKMPEDFYQFKSGDTVVTVDGVTLHTQVYAVLGQYYMLVPTDEVGDYAITYYRYPVLLPSDRGDVDPVAELDNVPETHLAIPYYVAGMLAMHDDPFLCATLMNGYEDKLAKMTPDISAEVTTTQDAYDFYTYHTYY